MILECWFMLGTGTIERRTDMWKEPVVETDEALMEEARKLVEKMWKFDKDRGVSTGKIPTVEDVFKKLKEKEDLDFTKEVP